MGCFCFTDPPPPVTTCRVRKMRPWQLREPITRIDLNRMRQEFWAQPHNRRTRPEIWTALQAACLILISATEPEPGGAQAVLEYVGIRRKFADLRICYDDRGVEYRLPSYLHSEPTNLIEN